MGFARLSSMRYSQRLDLLKDRLRKSQRFLIIQDLDGVCMELVRDPLRRKISPGYIKAANKLAGRFYVLTNGEHRGARGVNTLVECAIAESEGLSAAHVKRAGLYLPGLAAGGVQWQDCYGNSETPGVSAAELAFLQKLPDTLTECLGKVLAGPAYRFDEQEISRLLDVMILDNPLSPTININAFASRVNGDWGAFLTLQKAVAAIMADVLKQAGEQGLEDSFFIHFAPNLGRTAQGEIIKWANSDDLGTTDFQFMLRGAVKEVGVLVLLNRYYHQLTGHYPLGEGFNARSAARKTQDLSALAQAHFDPELMPLLVGIGDTVTSVALTDSTEYRRGGSDRGFLELVQDIGNRLGTETATVFVDSSQGELNRPQVTTRLLKDPENAWRGLVGISDRDDPLNINFVVPGGYAEYTKFFCQLAAANTS